MSPDRCPRVLAGLALSALCLATTGCFTVVDVSIHNVSAVDFRDVELGDTFYGDVPARTATEHKAVRLVPLLRYADVRLTTGGRRLTGQTLMHRASRFTHRVDVVDAQAGHIAIEVVRESDSSTGSPEG